MWLILIKIFDQKYIVVNGGLIWGIWKITQYGTLIYSTELGLP